MYFRDLKEGQEARIINRSHRFYDGKYVRREGKTVLLLDYPGQPSEESPDRWSNADSAGIQVEPILLPHVKTLIKGD